MHPKKQEAIIQAIKNAELRMEYNVRKIAEFMAINQSLETSIKLFKFELNKESPMGGFGDSMDFSEDGLSVRLGCGHVVIDENNICTNCKEKVDVKRNNEE